MHLLPRKTALALACTLLLVIASISSVAAAGAPGKKGVTPYDPPYYDVCVGLTIHHTSYTTSANFYGTIYNTCHDGITVTFYYQPTLTCLSSTQAEPARTSSVSLPDGGSTKWSITTIGSCISCNQTTHKITAMPSFFLKATASATGRTNLGVRVKAAAVTDTATLPNDQSLVGAPC